MWGFWILTEIFIYLFHQTYWAVKFVINMMKLIKEKKANEIETPVI